MRRSSDDFVFNNRREAGRILAERLRSMKLESPVVVGLPRGGVPVAYEVARALGAPLEIGLVRKLGAPGHAELAVGALGEDNTIVLDKETIRALAITSAQIEQIVERESAELERHRRIYRAEFAQTDIAAKTTIVVDDGIATGMTAVAAARVLKARGAGRVIVAVPVCPAGAEERLREHFDEIVCLKSPWPFAAVGAWYDDFSETTDLEVTTLLRRSQAFAR
jgi:putative phosphoribosyl transferase